MKHGERGFVILVLSSFLAALSSGCSLVGLSTNDNAVVAVHESASGAGGSALQVFQTGVYAYAQKNCIQCHGSSQAPLFAISNASEAYNNLLPYVDFSSPGSSPVVQYAGNGHCGVSNCSGASGSATMLNDVTLWAAAENTSGGAGSGGGSSGGSGLLPPSSAITYYTQPVPIPSNIAGAGTTFSILTFNLSGLSPANSLVSSADFQVEIQLLTPQTYRIASPVLAVTGNSSINVSGIHVMLRAASASGEGGEYNLGEGWNSINAPAAPVTIPAKLSTTAEITGTISLSSSDVPMPVGTLGSDDLIIGFESISTSCQNYNGTNGFETNVKPQMSSTCFNCHLASANNAAAFASFPMVNNNDAQLCANARQFANPSDPSQSAIVVDPQDGMLNGAAFNPTPFIQWVQTE